MVFSILPVLQYNLSRLILSPLMACLQEPFRSPLSHAHRNFLCTLPLGAGLFPRSFPQPFHPFFQAIFTSVFTCLPTEALTTTHPKILTKQVKYIHNKNFKILKKDIEEDTKVIKTASHARGHVYFHGLCSC
jgi:hypothetical protein